MPTPRPKHGSTNTITTDPTAASEASTPSTASVITTSVGATARELRRCSALVNEGCKAGCDCWQSDALS
jgi:hypothetical protein